MFWELKTISVFLAAVVSEIVKTLTWNKKLNLWPNNGFACPSTHGSTPYMCWPRGANVIINKGSSLAKV